MKFAGFWIRTGAAIIDGLILMVIFFLLEKITGFSFFQPLYNNTQEPAQPALLVIVTNLIWLLYFILFVASKWQATPGRRVFNIYVTTKDGAGKISLLRSIGRELGSIVSGLLLGIGYIMVAFTREKTGLHDIMAGTRVVYGRI